jgi:hypothetical protein
MADDGNLLSYSGAFGVPATDASPDNVLAAPAPQPQTSAPTPTPVAMPHATPAGPGSMTRSELEGGPPAPGTPGAAVAQRTHDFWASQGYTEPQIAGIMAGGPGSESNFTPTVFGDKGTSYGLYQHHGPRLTNPQGTGLFDRYGPNPTEDQQHAYAAWEISPQGPLAKVGEQLRAAKTAADAATVWTGGFGVPADKTEIGRRARGADRYVGLYNGGQPAGPVQVAATTAAPVAPAPTAPATPLNGLSSLNNLFSPEMFAKLNPLQKMAYVQQLQQLFAPKHAAGAQAGGGGPGAGGVDASIPMSGMRG